MITTGPWPFGTWPVALRNWCSTLTAHFIIIIFFFWEWNLRPAFWCKLKKPFFVKFCCKFLAFFSFFSFFSFFPLKTSKWRFRRAFGVRSTQTLVEIYNSQGWDSPQISLRGKFFFVKVQSITEAELSFSCFAHCLRLHVHHPVKASFWGFSGLNY